MYVGSLLRLQYYRDWFEAACPLIETGAKENCGRPQMHNLIFFGTLFKLHG